MLYNFFVLCSINFYELYYADVYVSICRKGHNMIEHDAVLSFFVVSYKFCRIIYKCHTQALPRPTCPVYRGQSWIE